MLSKSSQIIVKAISNWLTIFFVLLFIKMLVIEKKQYPVVELVFITPNKIIQFKHL